MHRNRYEALLLAPAPKLDGPVRLIRKREVCARVGFSLSELHRRIAAHDFPAPVRLGPKCRAVAFSEREVDAYIAALIADRDQGGAA